MNKDKVRAIIIAAEAKQYEFFEWFHSICDDYEVFKTDRHYILNRLGVDGDMYDDWLDEGDWD